MTLTLILWLVLGAVSMGGMLHVAAHKTVVISARGQEQGEIVPEYRTGENGEMQLPMMTDHVADRQICIPLEAGTKAENVVVENHYMEKELWVYIQTGRKTFYKEPPQSLYNLPTLEASSLASLRTFTASLTFAMTSPEPISSSEGNVRFNSFTVALITSVLFLEPGSKIDATPPFRSLT